MFWAPPPEKFFPAEPSDIYNEAAFPHEWNYGLSEIPLPKQLSVSGLPREGSLDFEYSERNGQEPNRQLYPAIDMQPFKKKFPRPIKHREPEYTHMGGIPISSIVWNPRIRRYELVGSAYADRYADAGRENQP